MKSQIFSILCMFAGNLRYNLSSEDKPFISDTATEDYPELSFDDKYLPHGRVNAVTGGTDIFIDKCCFHNEEIINRICELYRISGKIQVVWNGNYKCHICEDTCNDGKPIQSYFMENLTQ